MGCKGLERWAHKELRRAESSPEEAKENSRDDNLVVDRYQMARSLREKQRMQRNVVSDAERAKAFNAMDVEVKDRLIQQLFRAPIPKEELQLNLVLFQDRRVISRILFLNELYQRILSVHGNICEFGVRYGANLALLISLRGIYEPFNHNRKIVGFDTFSGFPSVEPVRDGTTAVAGDYAVPHDYEGFLAENLSLHESMAPLSQVKKFELVKGDATQTVHEYLVKHPETIISLAYFDMDLYHPTKACLEAILPYLTRGAVIGFDEVNTPDWPGETAALREVLSLGRFRLHHSPYRGTAAYLIYE